MQLQDLKWWKLDSISLLYFRYIYPGRDKPDTQEEFKDMVNIINLTESERKEKKKKEIREWEEYQII